MRGRGRKRTLLHTALLADSRFVGPDWGISLRVARPSDDVSPVPAHLLTPGEDPVRVHRLVAAIVRVKAGHERVQIMPVLGILKSLKHVSGHHTALLRTAATYSNHAAMRWPSATNTGRLGTSQIASPRTRAFDTRVARQQRCTTAWSGPAPASTSRSRRCTGTPPTPGPRRSGIALPSVAHTQPPASRAHTGAPARMPRSNRYRPSPQADPSPEHSPSLLRRWRCAPQRYVAGWCAIGAVSEEIAQR